MTLDIRFSPFPPSRCLLCRAHPLSQFDAFHLSPNFKDAVFQFHGVHPFSLTFTVFCTLSYSGHCRLRQA